MAQLVKNQASMRETSVWSMGWEDPLEKVFWPGEFHGLYNPWDHKESDVTEQLSLWPVKGLIQPRFTESLLCIWQLEHKDSEASLYFKAEASSMFRFNTWLKNKHQKNKQNSRNCHYFTNILFCQVRNLTRTHFLFIILFL